jgi:RNA polymerase sigma factor (TIGR02999 family)
LYFALHFLSTGDCAEWGRTRSWGSTKIEENPEPFRTHLIDRAIRARTEVLMYGHASDRACNNSGDVTNLLRDWRNGDQSALERLTPIIYDDLRRIARARLKGDRREFTLDATALVHECYLRLADQTRLDVESRAHFYSIAANVMRRVLIDSARKRNAQKRNAGLRITLKTGIDFADAPSLDTVLLDDALRKLADFDERKSQAITLKFFGGMTTEGIATALGISVATVGRELRLGQAWLRRELSTASV